MADGTHIEWTEATWNPITGRSLASPGCTNCYAMQLAGTRLAHIPSRAGLTRKVNGNHVWTGEVRFNEHELTRPLRWKRPRMIFVCAHGDLFHESVPDAWIDRIFAVMALCPQHTFQVLTKRSARMREYCQSRFETEWGSEMLCEAIEDLDGFSSDAGGDHDAPLPNVWLGVSVEDQQRANERIPDLLATPAAVRWISAEPLLGPVDLARINDANAPECFTDEHPVIPKLEGKDWEGARARLNSLTGFFWGEDLLDGEWEPWTDADAGARRGLPKPEQRRSIDWVVVGGESGAKARPMHPDWARALRDQCGTATVPFFFKQWGEFRPYCDADDFTSNDPTGEYGNPGARARHVPAFAGDPPAPGNIMIPVGKKQAGRLLDGVEHNGMPETASSSAAVGREGTCQ